MVKVALKLKTALVGAGGLGLAGYVGGRVHGKNRLTKALTEYNNVENEQLAQQYYNMGTMDKQSALSPRLKKILGTVAGGTAVTGAGYLGGRSHQNKRNNPIIDEFHAVNEMENNAIANEYYNMGKTSGLVRNAGKKMFSWIKKQPKAVAQPEKVVNATPKAAPISPKSTPQPEVVTPSTSKPERVTQEEVAKNLKNRVKMNPATPTPEPIVVPDVPETPATQTPAKKTFSRGVGDLLKKNWKPLAVGGAVGGAVGYGAGAGSSQSPQYA